MAALVEQAHEQLRQAAEDAAREATERHEELISDQLAEGGWEEAFEAFIDDFVTYPASFIRAPIFRRVPELQWLEGWRPVKGETIRPEFERVSPFDMYPSPDSTSIDDGAFIIERARFTRAQLNQLIGVPSYSEDAIRQVLDQYGQGGLRDWLWNDGERAELEGRGHEWLTSGETIDGLIYSGGAQGVTLLQWGIDPDEIEDPLAEYEVEAILIGQHVIRVRINRDPLERRPYHKASFQPVPGSFWGQGIPELMADVQDVCNATARGLVNNLAISSGPQVEVYEDRLQPQEDPTDIYPWKIWRTKDSSIASNNRALNFFQPQSNANELMAVYEKFEYRADESTNIPRYMYGNDEARGAGQTASGLSMLMESANKGIKDAIRHIDRGVLRRVIEALWLHNMQFSDDNSIKGDAGVVARGSSAMLIREQTNQLRQQFLQLTANDYDMGIIGHDGRRKLLESIAEKLDLPGLIPSEEEMQQNLAQQRQDRQAELQMEQAKAEAEAAEKQARAREANADAAQTEAETQQSQQMAPLEAQHLLAEIAKLITETRGRNDGGAGLEGAGQAGRIPGGAAPGVAAQGRAGGMPRQPGEVPRPR
ncbi:portal protein [Halomonas elongata]|uniref:portal protein n=1 Tax=Halomonas elongata TaxID=2746 RepID=UPI004033A362